jgi:hypothetical protein
MTSAKSQKFQLAIHLASSSKVPAYFFPTFSSEARKTLRPRSVPDRCQNQRIAISRHLEGRVNARAKKLQNGPLNHQREAVAVTGGVLNKIPPGYCCIIVATTI